MLSWRALFRAGFVLAFVKLLKLRHTALLFLGLPVANLWFRSLRQPARRSPREMWNALQCRSDAYCLRVSDYSAKIRS